MRLRVFIKPIQDSPHILPVNYQYPVSSWIYKTISQGDHAFASFLHKGGYGEGNKSFKFFTFSMLNFSSCHYQINGDRLELSDGIISIDISFLVPEALSHFVTGIFCNQEFILGDYKSKLLLKVVTVEAINEPQMKSEMSLRTTSPILVSTKNEGRKAARYLDLTDADYSNLIIGNLVSKYIAAVSAGLIIPDTTGMKEYNDETSIKINNTPRKKGIIIKAGTSMQTKIIGYMYDFTIKAPPHLIRIGYHAGFGEKNSLGMGCCEVITNKELTSG